MGFRQNIVNTLNAIKRQQHQTITEFSEKLNVSRSYLNDLLAAKGTPSIKTLERITKNLGLDSSALLSGALKDTQLQIIECLLQINDSMKTLSPEKRQAFADLFLKMVQLWDSEQSEIKDIGGDEDEKLDCQDTDSGDIAVPAANVNSSDTGRL